MPLPGEPPSADESAASRTTSHTLYPRDTSATVGAAGPDLVEHYGRRWLFGADDFEVVVEEDVVGQLTPM
jgi:hypothetical protein